MSAELRVPFARVDCSGNERRYIDEVLATGWLTSASKTRELEERVAARLGVRHALAVNSCTAALHLSLEALGVGPGQRVFVPTFTFTASAEVIRYLGADPVFLDVDPDTGALSPAIVARAIREHPDVRTLVVVHYGGQAVEMLDGEAVRGGTAPGESGVLALCRANGIRTVEDAAHALPARQGGRWVGALGELTCFSFYANKTMTTGEGGLVATDDDALAARIRSMRLHGISRDVWERRGSSAAAWEYDVVAPGFKYNMPDLNAAVGLAQFERLDAMRERRQRCAERYLAAFAGHPHLRTLRYREPLGDHAWHLFPIRVGAGAPLDRQGLIEGLAAAGVGTSVHYRPLHLMSYYKDRYALSASDFPDAQRLWESIVSLPLYSSMTDEDVDFVIESVDALLGTGDEALTRLLPEVDVSCG